MDHSPHQSPIPALTANSPGYQFVVYGDCCAGIPGHPFEPNFIAINATLQRVNPAPEFILFAGDHIYGFTEDMDELREQWRYFFQHQMAWHDRNAIPMYSSTSNHNTYSAPSEQVFREVFADLPRNGPLDQQGLSYWVRRGDLLIVVVNTSFSGLGGYGHVECDWLNQVLSENADAKYKLIMGHHPVWPVNGYGETPLWCIAHEQGRAMWQTLVRHRATAYLCSHIIAFDVQAHDGVLQMTTGGAGTIYGPGGCMDSPDEYHHFVQLALDTQGLRGRTIDIDGNPREQFHWQPAAACLQQTRLL